MYTNEFITYHKITNDLFEINSVGNQNNDKTCLFNLQLDPCEYYDLSHMYSYLIHTFQNRLDELQSESVEPLMGK